MFFFGCFVIGESFQVRSELPVLQGNGVPCRPDPSQQAPSAPALMFGMDSVMAAVSVGHTSPSFIPPESVEISFAASCDNHGGALLADPTRTRSNAAAPEIC